MSDIPAEAKWMPASWMDETVPPARATPSDWIVRQADGGWALASGWDDDDDRTIVEGEIVEFHAVIELASATLAIDDDENDGRTWFSNPPGPFIAPPGFEISAYDGESVWGSLEDAAQELDEGTYDMEVYAWTSAARKFRFTDGRFEPVRQDA
jgi:hypothetical protein